MVTLKNGADDLTLTLNEIYESNNNTNEQDFNSRVDFELPFKNRKGNLYFGGRLRNKQKERVNSYDIYTPITTLASGGNNLGSLTFSKQNDRIFLNGDKYVPGNNVIWFVFFEKNYTSQIATHFFKEANIPALSLGVGINS